ncbi:MAG: hypothetical protein JW922_01860 [Paludibacteraceae bacterium]|nr:hypothetical protein [Paludibacteraceae bacterium]
MLDTRQKTKLCKNVAIALVKDEDGRVLLVKPSENPELTEIYESTPANSSVRTSPVKTKKEEWDFPSNMVEPGASYTETFSTNLLEATGCIVEAISLVSSEKHSSGLIHYEYVECKIVCRDKPIKGKAATYKWVHPSRLRNYFKQKLNRDLAEFFRM